jgi:hypothetical protein
MQKRSITRMHIATIPPMTPLTMSSVLDGEVVVLELGVFVEIVFVEIVYADMIVVMTCWVVKSLVVGAEGVLDEEVVPSSIPDRSVSELIIVVDMIVVEEEEEIGNLEIVAPCYTKLARFSYCNKVRTENVAGTYWAEINIP